MSDITDPSSVYIKAAQYFVRKKLEELKSAKFNFKATPDRNDASAPLSWNKLSASLRLGQPPPSGARVAIIGAGVAGLRTAMLLEKLKIPYRIFEANDGPGGRLFTYRFPSDPTKSPPGKHDYYEVGGMRFPDNAANKPTFDLFKELGFRFRDEQNPDGELIPFVYSKDDNIRHFNNITTTAREVANGVNLFNEGKPTGNVPKDFTDMQDVDEQGNVYRGVDACFFKAFNDLRAKLLANFDEEWPKLLQEWDWASTRSYLAQADELKFPPPVIDWIEKHKSGTGRYARAVVEEVLESITFDHPKSEQFDWWCIEGGSEGLIAKMLSKLTNPPSYNHRVTAITEDPARRIKVSVLDKEDDYFSHVVSTVTFAVLRTINTDGVHMNFNQREAMRALNYGQSIKVGIKFKTRWWEHVTKAPQLGGASRTDRQTRVVVYPSYGLNETGPGVLMASYNWDQDAARFGALIKNTLSHSEQPKPDRPRSPSERVLLDQIYQDLAVLHTPNNSALEEVEEFKKMLIKDTLDFHAFDWYHNPFTMGAFAQFTPGQFSTLYADILQPAGRYGNFHFAGELASHHHAWVAGALDSATRVVGHIEKSLHAQKGLSNFTSTLPRSLVFDSEESANNWHIWGLVEEA
ncbi:L-amino acid oxidase 1 [Gymnopilus junonius]|uniref:L-amino acid oxidase 1 n=1 Tax=Gymnopilus junonius TaxID=109634 RepID=A0A9P5NF72_GYMJU|nr:L-amino acid oxidase 1 [Gymnopilus junonius]